jgi:4a-hydroxytetrahydrobiopterin dehydratase
MGCSVAQLAPPSLGDGECLLMNRPSRLTEIDIADRLRGVAAWRRDGDRIVRTYECADFAAAIAFVVRAGFAAERLDHHPDLDIRWRRVHVECTTHDAEGLTELDFALAVALDRAFDRISGEA